jgi:hypothetical protein
MAVLWEHCNLESASPSKNVLNLWTSMCRFKVHCWICIPKRLWGKQYKWAREHYVLFSCKRSKGQSIYFSASVIGVEYGIVETWVPRGCRLHKWKSSVLLLIILIPDSKNFLESWISIVQVPTFEMVFWDVLKPMQYRKKQQKLLVD